MKIKQKLQSFSKKVLSLKNYNVYPQKVKIEGKIIVFNVFELFFVKLCHFYLNHQRSNINYIVF